MILLKNINIKMKLIDKTVSWKDLNIMLSKNDLSLLGRTKKHIEMYNKEKKINKVIFNSPEDMIKIRCLDYLPIQQNNKLYAQFYPNLSKKINITDNKYPYNVEAYHKILWCEQELSNEQIRKLLSVILRDKEYTYFRNPPHLRSIPNLFHIHIFIKK